jgi:glycosyltransferase involved in cell wall biosynthesis
MPSKGLHVLIDAFRGLTENARLTVFGGAPAGDPGEYARGVLASAADRRIAFPGRIDPREVASAFRAIDVLVVPSLWFENAPLTIREAFASHTPVVASRCGGMAECVRDGIDGLLFAPGSVADLRAALRRLARDPELIATLSRQAPPVKTIAQQAVELDASYERLMRRQARLPDDIHADIASHP